MYRPAHSWLEQSWRCILPTTDPVAWQSHTSRKVIRLHSCIDVQLDLHYDVIAIE